MNRSLMEIFLLGVGAGATVAIICVIIGVRITENLRNKSPKTVITHYPDTHEDIKADIIRLKTLSSLLLKVLTNDDEVAKEIYTDLQDGEIPDELVDELRELGAISLADKLLKRVE